MRYDNGEVTISVRDNGIGIAPHMLPRIFDMFTRAEGAFVKGQGGLGIGLTLVKQLVEMHGGTITAESPGECKGSTFTIRLPARIAARAQVTQENVPANGGEHLRVLVMDDNHDAADILTMAIEVSGHAVKAAYGGVHALEIATKPVHMARVEEPLAAMIR